MTQVADDALRALIQDLEAAQQCLNEGKYDKIVIQANRMISEGSVFLTQPRYVVSGLVARLSALEVQAVVVPDKLLAYPQKQAMASLLGDLRSSLDDPNSRLDEAWKAFEKFYGAFWADIRPQLEGKSYTENLAFVAQVLDWSSSIIAESWTLLGEARGSPFVGLANEISRVLRAHGATSRQLASYGLIQSLAWYAEYAKWQSGTADGGVDAQKLRSLLQPHVGRVVELLKTKDNPDVMFSECAEALHDILRAWRIDFTKYYDLFQQQQERPRFALVPAATKPEETATKRQRKKAG